MNNPFHYTPSKRMTEASRQLSELIIRHCHDDESFSREVDAGKMFGILLVDNSDSPAMPDVLFAFSGQIVGRFDIEGFVPPVFDYLDDRGHFKTEERAIVGINESITALQQSPQLASRREALSRLQHEAQTDIDAYRHLMTVAKTERDMLRGTGLTPDSELIKESQYMKATLRRKRRMWQQRIEEAQTAVDEMTSHITRMKLERQRRSDALQRWLFSQFVLTNCKGISKSIPDIWNDSFRPLTPALSPLPQPPSGSGECCEPKLLHYAFTHSLRPLEIGMIWWGAPPRGEVRHHGRFYPACNGKCKPLLRFLLDDPTLGNDTAKASPTLRIVYEDDAITVVDKPAGMLSVNGRSTAESVYTHLCNRHPERPPVHMVHRLDMDTSGLLVVANTKEAHRHLQRQFAEHTIRKTYTALLEHEIHGSGTISLPLRADYDDRPRQMVDISGGKQALTEYASAGGCRVRLSPLTGRTHQLRLHCAHHLGLANPIVGDRLYGNRGTRLCLHASSITFTHPVTGDIMTFESTPDF